MAFSTSFMRPRPGPEVSACPLFIDWYRDKWRTVLSRDDAYAWAAAVADIAPASCNTQRKRRITCGLRSTPFRPRSADEHAVSVLLRIFAPTIVSPI